MKVSVITLQAVPNYGSCLQAFATQKVFEKIGCEAEIINYRRELNSLEYNVEKSFTEGRLSRFEQIWKTAPFIKDVVSRFIVRPSLVRRQAVFEKFCNKHLNLSSRLYESERDLEKNVPEADLYCTGSDQVWNSIWNGGYEKPLYLEFVPEGKRCIAFAASIGRETLAEWEKPILQRSLSKYNAISMREASGVAALKEIGIDSVHVLDPTLMLDRGEWSKLGVLPVAVHEPYILIYRLNPNEDFSAYAEAVSKRSGLPLLNVAFRNSEKLPFAKNIILPEVEELLGLFLNASAVITDSFHATAFSLNFEVPFISIAPPRFSERIKSILSKTGTEERLLKSFDDYDLITRPVLFSQSTKILDGERKKCYNFLVDAVGVR